MKDEQTAEPASRTWLERIGQALLGEPKDRDELVGMLRDAQQRDLLDSDALAMMEGVVQVSEMQVRDIMISRAQMVVMEHDWPMEKILEVAIESGHSRFPVIEEDRDDISGILLVKDLLGHFARGGGELKLGDFLRPAKFIPESKRLNVLLKEFRSTRLHMAIVVDEYGGTAGLVTIEDVLEQIVGEIDDEHDADDDAANIRESQPGEFVIKALTPVEDFNEHFSSDFSEEKADTIGGLIMMELGHLPKRGEEVEIQDFRFKILRADNRRIHLVSTSRVSRQQVEERTVAG